MIAGVIAVAVLGVGAGVYLSGSEGPRGGGERVERSRGQERAMRKVQDECLSYFRSKGMRRENAREGCACIMEEVRAIVAEQEESGGEIRDKRDIEDAIRDVTEGDYTDFVDCIDPDWEKD